MSDRLRQGAVIWLVAPVLILLALDLGLLLVHLLSARLGAGHLDPAWLVVHRWRVDSDGGAAETVQYLKFLFLAVGALVAWLRGYRSGLVLGALFVALLLDDALQGHELAGSWLAARLALPGLAGLPPYDVGELLAWTLPATVFCSLLVVAWRRGHAPERRFVATLTTLLAMLALFGLGLDAAASLAQSRVVGVVAQAVIVGFGEFVYGPVWAPNFQPLNALAWAAGAYEFATGEAVAAALSQLRTTKVFMTVVEEGGEMITVSLMVGYIVGFLARGATVEKYAHRVGRHAGTKVRTLKR